MLYALTKQIKGEKVHVPVLGIIPGDDRNYTFGMIMGTGSVIQSLYDNGDRLTVISDFPSDIAGEETLVYPIVEGSSSSINSADILYRNIYLIDKDFYKYDVIHSKLVAVDPQITVPMIESIFQSFREMDQYASRKSEQIIAIPSNFLSSIEDRQNLNIYNEKRNSQLSFINSAMNVTRKMENEFDEVFFKLPRYEVLLDASDYSNLAPSLSDITEPYPHPVYYTPYGLYSYDMSTAEKEGFLKSNQTATGGRLIALPPSWNMKDIPLIPKKHIIGSPSNNTIPIREEEFQWAEAMKELIRYDIKQRFPDMDQEEAYRTGVISTEMTNFLMAFTESLAQIYWSHNNKIPVIDWSILEAEEIEDADASDKSLTTDLNQYYIFNYDHKLLKRMDGLPMLRSYMTRVLNTVGVDGIVEALVKLARWGDLKPSILAVEGFGLYLDLNLLQISNTTGDISCLNPVLHEGHKYEFKGVILQGTQMNDRQFLESNSYKGFYEVPVGVVLEMHLEKGYSQTIFMSNLDIIREYQANPESKLIYGIEFDGSKFVDNLNLDLDTVTTYLNNAINLVIKDEDSLFLIETSQDCKKIEMQSSIKKGLSPLESINAVFSTRDIMSEIYPQAKVDSILNAQDISAKINFGLVNILQMNSFVEIIKVMDSVEKDLSGESEFTVATILNSYQKNMKESGYVSEFQFLSEISGTRTSVLKNEGTMLSSFTKPKEEKDLKTLLTEALIVPIGDDSKIFAVNMYGKVIAGATTKVVKDKPSYIFTSPTRVNTFDVVAKGEQLIPIMLNSIHRLLHGVNINAYFSSLSDMQEIIAELTPPKEGK